MQKPDDNLHQFISVSILFVFFFLNNVVLKSVLFSDVFCWLKKLPKIACFSMKSLVVCCHLAANRGTNVLPPAFFIKYNILLLLLLYNTWLKQMHSDTALKKQQSSFYRCEIWLSVYNVCNSWGKKMFHFMSDATKVWCILTVPIRTSAAFFTWTTWMFANDFASFDSQRVAHCTSDTDHRKHLDSSKLHIPAISSQVSPNEDLLLTSALLPNSLICLCMCHFLFFACTDLRRPYHLSARALF